MKSHKMTWGVLFLIVASTLNLQSAIALQESDRDRNRDGWQRPAEVFGALAVKPGHRVADIGSGFGYFTFRLAARVGAEGKVYAVDVDQKAIDKVRERIVVSPCGGRVWFRMVIGFENQIARRQQDLLHFGILPHLLPGCGHD